MRVKKFEAKTMKEALHMVKREMGPDAVILSARDNRKSFGLLGDGSVEVTAAVSESTLHKKRFAESRLSEPVREKFQTSSARVQKQVIDRMVVRRLADGSVEPERRPITSVPYIAITDEPASEEARRQRQARSQQRPMGRRGPEGFAAQDPARTRNGDNTSRNGAAVPRTVGRNVEELLTEYPEDRSESSSAPNMEGPDGLPSKALDRIRSAAKEAWRGAGLFDDAPARRAPAKAPGAAPGSASIPAPASASSEPGRAPVAETEVLALKSEIHRLQQMIDGFHKVPQTFVTMHPGADCGIPYELSFMFQKLTEVGVNMDLAVEILSGAQKELPSMAMKKKPLVDAWVARWFLNNIDVTPDPYRSRVHLFVGGAGSGKTSHIVKMASQLVVKEKRKVAILTTDSFKVGSADQMKIYCQILNVPFAIVRNKVEWAWVLNQLSQFDHILVDFPGLQLRDLDEIHLIKSLLPPKETAATCHFVTSTTTKDSDAMDMARRYKVAGFDDLIFTNLDQSVQHGLIYNLQKRLGKPLHSFGIGSRIPEDFELATKERVLDLIFKLTKLRREMR